MGENFHFFPKYKEKDFVVGGGIYIEMCNFLFLLFSLPFIGTNKKEEKEEK